MGTETTRSIAASFVRRLFSWGFRSIQSVEMCCNEYALQLFQQSDSRILPPDYETEHMEIIPMVLIEGRPNNKNAPSE